MREVLRGLGWYAGIILFLASLLAPLTMVLLWGTGFNASLMNAWCCNLLLGIAGAFTAIRIRLRA